MGFPLVPVLANLFMGYHEKLWLENYDGASILFYHRYVDDTFCIFHNDSDVMLFLDYLNHQNVKVKVKVTFLCVLVTKSTNTCTTTTFHKKTYISLPRNYKIGPVKYNRNWLQRRPQQTYSYS